MMKKPEEILNGNDMSKDIHYLMGYVYTLGLHDDYASVFPSKHLLELAECFLKKYRPLPADEETTTNLSAPVIADGMDWVKYGTGDNDYCKLSEWESRKFGRND